ncbi:lysozyme inhibitor LprI family protein [Bacillus sp. REN10]|uniref:lysozyme inhibitor LprI family protein n=1 Tax=Bacillus sp. REN10 TaxID=2782541 RepID=UPI00193B6117|nr:lysozyme inhibitor LprI family protein [Bacillus sp. REN10]
MVLKKKWLIILVTITTVLLLAACSSSNESKIIGSWKAVADDDTLSYLEIGEERIIIRSQSDDKPMTADYILTETQDENFIIELINPEDGSVEFLFEGYFENKDKIMIVETLDGAAENSKLIRVDNIAEEKEKEEKALAKEEKRLQEKEKALAKEEKRLQEKEKQALAKEEKRLQEEKEVKQRTTEENSLKKEYLQKADDLENRIVGEAKKLYAHDMRPGFYSQYYSDWDGLLNEIWGVLKDTMPKNEFEKLKSDQVEWIKMKEQNFAEMPQELASERASGMDYLAFETKERTYYLIENYMD